MSQTPSFPISYQMTMLDKRGFEFHYEPSDNSLLVWVPGTSAVLRFTPQEWQETSPELIANQTRQFAQTAAMMGLS